ncbi:MAG: hypothetical protein J5964_04275 [Eubacterium sp.]|nr:hypothetical protein [Eubacterium sp.]
MYRLNKKTVAAVVAITLAALVVFGYSVKYSRDKNEERIASVSTTKMPESTTVNRSGAELLSESEDKKFQLYYIEKTELAYIVYEGKEFDCNWGWSVKLHKPDTSYFDVDGDGEKDFLVRILAEYSTDDASNAAKYEVYNLYMYKGTEKDGEPDLEIFFANKQTWREPFSEAVKCEVTQLKSSKKFIQVAMNNADRSISYDDSGLTDNKYTYYAAAFRDDKNNYFTLANWHFNQGIYKFDEENEKLRLTMSIIVEYRENEFKEYLGDVTCEIGIVNGRLAIVPMTIIFEPLSKKVVVDPRNMAEKDWSITIKNSAADPKASSADINWIENQFDVSTLGDQTDMDFSKLTSKIKYIDTVEISQSGIVLTAFPNYTYSDRVLQNGVFSVVIDDGNGTRQIDYTCVEGTKNGRSTLTITFDKTYNKDELKDMRIKFGA